MDRPIIGLTGRTWQPSSSNDTKLARYGAYKPYLDAIFAAGGVPLILPLPDDPHQARIVYDTCSGIMLTGGEDVDPAHYNSPRSERVADVDKDRDRMEIALVKWAIEEHKPILGICRGLQVMNVALGGSLHQDIPTELPDAELHTRGTYDWDTPLHQLTVAEDTILWRCLGLAPGEKAPTNSLHHQAVQNIAPGLRINARSDDGVIEGLEHQSERFAVGVQCHPETIYKQEGSPWLNLFQEFVQASREFASTVPLHYVPLVPYTAENFQKR